MKYYVITIEQVYNEGQLGEYMTKSDPQTEKSARTMFFDKCSAINADLSDKGHAWAYIAIVNSKGGTEKEEKLGQYVEQ